MEGRRSIPPIDISSSAIRERRRQNLSFADLVPAPVADHIVRHGLYQEPTEEPLA